MQLKHWRLQFVAISELSARVISELRNISALAGMNSFQEFLHVHSMRFEPDIKGDICLR